MHIESSTPSTARPIRARRGVIVLAAVLACAALMSACGSSSSTTSTATTSVDTHRVALSIEQSILAKRHLHATVSCPATVPQETGKTFVCIASNRATKAPFTVTRTPFTVTVQNSRGYVTYVGQ
jgi:hypothetical protein